MTKSKIYFRADGNTEIGLGHITRSMALADMLKENFNCVFLVRNPSEILQKQIRESFTLIVLPQTQDYLQEAYFIKETYLQANDIIVLDGYNFQTDYQKILKTKKIKLVCIDDMHAWHFVADAVINHAGGVQESEYSCENYTKLYLGTDYALLRKPFLEAAKKERKIEKIEKVFICFGGSDIHNLSQKATEACLTVEKFTEIHVVLGSAYPYFQEFTNFAQEYKKVQIHQNLDAQEMCDLMQHCQLAIAPASSIAYEICAVGMYLITGWYVENQKGIYQFLSKNALCLGVENFQNLSSNVSNFEIEIAYLQNQKKDFNAKIMERIISVFL
ncbi:MAG: UDP-2,4-diacetamido-2,4,6-trideoxy-beta-L-altropyranose hydrolase [Thermonemataceae bacterium]|nr:UDP-2,4-diacetamido-2,4,6-trideoxy-beta-L-altropyranose hydrolase [Thermonemataceae bacterium]